jgi:hypothetical protein
MASESRQKKSWLIIYMYSYDVRIFIFKVNHGGFFSQLLQGYIIDLPTQRTPTGIK